MMVLNKRYLLALATLVVASAAMPQQPFDLDPTFRCNMNGDFVTSVAPMNNGNLLLSGNIRYPGTPIGVFPQTLGMVQSNGSLITTYEPGAWGVGGGYRITPWQDKFYVYNGIVHRLLANGEKDNTFHDMIPTDRWVYSALQAADYSILSDGRILLSGQYFLDSNQVTVGIYSLLWLTNTGRVDTTRTHRTSTYSIYKIQELPTGQFICFTSSAGLVQGIPTERIFRIQPDGALDTTFHAPHMDHGQVNTFYPLSDGKVLVGGRFNLAGISDTLSWVRLLPDGPIDSTFNYHAQFSLLYPSENIIPSVTCFLPIGQDKMIITGGFDHIEGEIRGAIAIVDTAGNLLNDYFNGLGCGHYIVPSNDWLDNQSLSGITSAPDGSYYIYGAYRGYDDGTTNDTLQGFVSRLYGLNVGIQEQDTQLVQALSIAPNPSSGATVFSVASASRASATSATAPVNAQLTIHDGSGRLVWQAAWPPGEERYTLPAGALAPGAYVVRVASASRASRASATSATATETPAYTGRLVVMPY